MRLRTTGGGSVSTRDRRSWHVCWPGDLDIRDEFRNIGVFPINCGKFRICQFQVFLFFGIVARFGDKERSVSIGDFGEFALFEELIFDKVDIADI